MLSEQTLVDLRRERERLMRMRDEAIAGIEAIDKLLVKSPNVLPFDGGTDKPYASMGFREAIRDVLARHAPAYMKPKAIARELARGGFVLQSGKTSLDTRVANEVFRIAKAGYAVRSPRKGEGWAIAKGRNAEGTMR